MGEFMKYQHVERFGSDEVEGIDLGRCYIFPKIDGTNGVVWHNGEKIYAGSRNRQLSLDNDNQGFLNVWVEKNKEKLERFFNYRPNAYIYGEWLVPHTLKDYRKEAWQNFYVFDVVDDGAHLPYDDYIYDLDQVGIEYITPLCIINKPSYEQLISWLDKNYYLMQDGCIGEGIVIKNYDYRNKYGRQTWAKIVRSEFKEKHCKTMGAPDIKGADIIEEKVVDKYLSEALIEKEYQKIANEKGWQSKFIPMLFGVTWHTFVTEETWNIVKGEKNPRLDYQRLYHFVVEKTKRTKTELF